MIGLIPFYAEWLMGNEFSCVVYAYFFHLKVWENYLSGRKDRLCCDRLQVLPNPLSAASAPPVP